MKRFIEGVDRTQSTLFPERLEDWIGEDNPVRVIDVFVDELDLGGLGFERFVPQETGRPGYHPSVLLKLYIYGDLNVLFAGLSSWSHVGEDELFYEYRSHDRSWTRLSAQVVGKRWRAM